MEGIVASRYALSLFELATEQDILDEVLDELKLLEETFKQLDDFSRLLNTPAIDKKEKIKLIDNIFSGKLNQYVLNFLKLLTEKGRLPHFNDILAEYKKLYNQSKNIREVVAVTALPLEERLFNKLKLKLEEITKQNIVLSNVVDESIMGGVVLKMQDKQMDNSVKSRLDMLKKSISSLTA